jgi:hypothetical protein
MRLSDAVFQSYEHKNSMLNQTAVIGQRKKIAFLAHDNKKADLLE